MNAHQHQHERKHQHQHKAQRIRINMHTPEHMQTPRVPTAHARGGGDKSKSYAGGGNAHLGRWPPNSFHLLNRPAHRRRFPPAGRQFLPSVCRCDAQDLVHGD